MKTKFKNAVSILALSLFILSCSKGNDDLSHLYEDEAVVPIEEALELGSISLNPILKDIIQVTTGKPPTLESLLDNMTVLIADDFGNTILSSNYRDLPNPIELPTGSYQLFMSNYSGFSAGLPRFDVPIHGSQTLFVIVNEGANTLVDVSLRLFDVATTINMSSGLLIKYPDIVVSTEVEHPHLGSSILTWNSTDNGRTGYHDLVHPENGFIIGVIPVGSDLTVTINAINSSGIPVVVSKTYPYVGPNEHYIISIEQAGASTISLNVTLEDEVVYNDVISF